jgi:hypothetical protein
MKEQTFFSEKEILVQEKQELIECLKQAAEVISQATIGNAQDKTYILGKIRETIKNNS